MTRGERGVLSREAWLWIVFLTFLTSSFLLLLAGSPVLSAAALALLLVWVFREALFTWVTGLSLLLLVLLFIPSRIYALPVSLPFDLDPYRFVLLVLVLVWIVSTFAQRRGHVPRTYLDTAVVVFLLAVVMSYLVNAPLFSSRV